MGFSDISPPSTTCLKRRRPDDPPYLLHPPPPKQPFCSRHHHLSILRDLENSLDPPSGADTAAPPEALVAEMIQSLQKAMGNIADLMTTSDGSPGSPFCVESSSLPDSISGSAVSPTRSNLGQPSEMATADSLQMHDLCGVRDDGAGARAGCATADGLAVLRSDTGAADGHATFEYGLVCTNYNPEVELAASSRLDAGFPIINLTNEDMPAAAGDTELKAPLEKIDYGWSMLDEFADNFPAAFMPFARNVWLEDEGDILPFSCSEAEGDTCLLNARDNPGFLLLDCFL